MDWLDRRHPIFDWRAVGILHLTLRCSLNGTESHHTGLTQVASSLRLQPAGTMSSIHLTNPPPSSQTGPTASHPSIYRTDAHPAFQSAPTASHPPSDSDYANVCVRKSREPHWAAIGRFRIKPESCCHDRVCLGGQGCLRFRDVFKGKQGWVFANS